MILMSEVKGTGLEDRSPITSSSEAGVRDARLRALHRATLSLVNDLTLDRVLQRIVSAARDLVEAHYAALGIPDGKGGLATFVTAGITPEDAAKIAHAPLGLGLLGEMIRTGQSVRIPEISQHPSSIGFPPGHPHMHSFLGVPIAAYGRPLGQIYLADKIGGDVFSEEDQQMIEMLAAHAAAAIENARLLQRALGSEKELTQRNEELELINSLATTVSSELSLQSIIDATLARVVELFAAQAGVVFLREDTTSRFKMALHQGIAEDVFKETETFRTGEGWLGSVAKSGEPAWATRMQGDLDLHRQKIVDAGLNSLVCVPLMAQGRVVGVLELAFEELRDVSASELGLLEAVGAGVGIAVENARLNRQARRVAVLEERERIAMDLHDGIIQSIYAVGLALESSRMFEADSLDDLRAGLGQAIEGLNAIIRDIRAYILDLQPSRISTDDLGGALQRLAREFKSNTLIEPEVVIDPAAIGILRSRRSNGLFLIAQEALANVAKHAKASRAWLTLRLSDGEISMQIIDNGRGFDRSGSQPVLGHGLSNIEQRAHIIGGDVEFLSEPGQGTTVTVRLPIAPVEPQQSTASDD
jgi:two-component system sensor histidine kinase DevS